MGIDEVEGALAADHLSHLPGRRPFRDAELDYDEAPFA